MNRDIQCCRQQVQPYGWWMKLFMRATDHARIGLDQPVLWVSPLCGRQGTMQALKLPLASASSTMLPSLHAMPNSSMAWSGCGLKWSIDNGLL